MTRQDELYETEEFEEFTGGDDSRWDGLTDYHGNGCDWYDLSWDNQTRCGHISTNDFDFSSTKCAALVEEVKMKYWTHPVKICVNTDFNKVNADGYPCSYLNLLKMIMAIAYGCETQADTSEFTASNMCCACGGGDR